MTEQQATVVTDEDRTFFRITIPYHESAGNIIADIAHKDGSLKASKRSVLKNAQQIINEIRNNPNITLSDISEKLGVSRRWIATNMKRLQDTGVLKELDRIKVVIGKL